MIREEQLRVERVRDVVDIGELDARGLEAVVDGVIGKLPGGEGQRALAVLDAREALLLGGRAHCAVDHQARRRVVVCRIDAERDHAASRSSRAAAATDSGATRRRQSWWPLGQVLL